ncbi:MAG: hypothetical protein KOO60_11630 [Gemmatimonadales bacterium]|nr:hypothetical protein [Gemmatimonadales bacterium]
MRNAAQIFPLSLQVFRCKKLASFLVMAILLLLAVGDSKAFVKFDFEQKFYVHPQRQVWDFSLIRPDSVYHIFYHSILESTPHAAHADTIWHATSADLRCWSAPLPILFSGSNTWDEAAIWAPDIFRDDAGGRWILAYTGCDAQMNQRTLMAESNDLETWQSFPENPVLEPDPANYVWDPNEWWSDFRDPFVYRQDEQWHILITAKQWLGVNSGILYHGVSDNLLDWTDEGFFFANDGDDPWRVLESPQYFVRGSTHHLMFGEYDTRGISLVSGPSPDVWTMADRVILDYGYAPEVDQFDSGIDVFSRITPFQNPQQENLSYVARFDTLLTNAEGGDPLVYKAHPLEEDWAIWTGLSNLANPTFGDNPAYRGDEPCGLVGHGFYGSQEYYQGPLSGRGSPGTRLGDGVTGTLTSYPFVITGNRMDLLVGGGHYPETCYVALVSSLDSTILFSETGTDQELMTPRQWDLRPYQGQTAYITIVDAENGPFGHINVDEIEETWFDYSGTGTPSPTVPLLNHSVSPNPFNPMTRIRFFLPEPGSLSVRIQDIRGRLVWESGLLSCEAGENSVTWTGLDQKGGEASSGTYIYSIQTHGASAGSGKITLLR